MIRSRILPMIKQDRYVPRLFTKKHKIPIRFFQDSLSYEILKDFAQDFCLGITVKDYYNN